MENLRFDGALRWGMHGNETGILFGFILDKVPGKGYYVILILIFIGIISYG
jgi:F0F1-type ATP synthase assembly protein I